MNPADVSTSVRLVRSQIIHRLPSALCGSLLSVMFFNGGIFCVGLLLIFSIGLKCENSETKSPNERTIIRLLSKYFTPKSYDVRLQSIVESENIVSFKGNVQIEILCLKSFDYIRLNAYKTDIYLSSVQVRINLTQKIGRLLMSIFPTGF